MLSLILPTDAGSFVVGTEYIISSVGDTDFTLIGASDNNVGTKFFANGIDCDLEQQQILNFLILESLQMELIMFL